ncbi:competence ComEA-like protein [Clostridium pasteurianum DSM 525 = ATCC 6013]|uniref:Competence ComEA-like protein n=1 Tax=Clostridium pasteurianum DSM 525 = ATCC 6013 TaxID=1262449 RepID=A0A0H3J5D3_CLOPA|nr:SLBB domain-containing protein [Clostridium pasteurianum]AJA48397.1 competence ComEA-like protein [Clostridium pasteurianum DSM 525 = ATCC 6013]AJA52385.1 competence ComEA-like protein [Clostridium pasteurianum DSM 525 = ATCC 6013]AOZ75642.1 competence protein ComEA [Clostridium pasteurianum DSM 525 = ATCC 6013]AOZ79438.1 competence protein ComEA [Clostridium pasteurianum]ELP60453.1 Competence ComEA protein [Clostridium pasteurianum DSM 525 = ATCC 6013]
MNKKKFLGSIIILSIFLIFLFVGYRLQNEKANSKNDNISIYKEENMENNYNEANNEIQNTKDSDGKKEIKAQIYGEIKNPGVYSLKSGDRIKDLIDLAGGFTENSEPYSINGAKKVVDGDNIEIKSKQDKLKGININKSESNSSLNNSGDSGSNNENEKLDINSASEEDIVNKKIPGIAKGLSKKIVEYREKNNGRINSQKDLEKAIGPKRAEKIMEYIEIN